MEHAFVRLLGSQKHVSQIPSQIRPSSSSSSLSFNFFCSSFSSFTVRKRYKRLSGITSVWRPPPNSQPDRIKPQSEAEKQTKEINQVYPEWINSAVISSCLVGVLTGIGVVLFNNAVHEIRDFVWDGNGVPYRGATLLREEPFQAVWARVILVPACGGFIVGLLNLLRQNPSISDGNALEPFFKALAACVTLGTGNSLGPEGPSVDIGKSFAKGIGFLFDRSSERKLSLVAAGSAAGIAAGFNAAVAGCFFAVESVLWPAQSNSALSLTNATSMVILSSVIASVVSEVGLGSEPAFKVPDYDFRSPSELPLYLLLGILCGLVSLTFSRCTSYMLVIVENLQKALRIPKAAVPALGGLAVGTMALAYPEILYWGFENVDILLESQPFTKGISAELLLQLVAVKIFASSLSRASGLVGGYYAPSIFIGAATGMAYGKIISFAVSQSYPIFDFSIFEVASPQAYGLVGMAATLAGVCQVPLTAVLLLFELTQDYRIVIPLLGAVGFSSLITSGQTTRKDVKGIGKLKENQTYLMQQLSVRKEAPYSSNLCEIESSLCLDDSSGGQISVEKKVLVSEAMRTRYVTVLMSSSLTEAVNLMLVEKQPCAMIVDDDNYLIGLLKLSDIKEFSTFAKAKSCKLKDHVVSDMCMSNAERCQVSWTATPNMDLLSAQMIMDGCGIYQVPVVLEHAEVHKRRLVGLLDRECITVTCKALETRESLK